MSAAWVVALLAAAAVLLVPSRSAGGLVRAVLPGASRRGGGGGRRRPGRRLRPDRRAAEREVEALIEVVESLDAALGAGASPLDALASVAAVRAAVRAESAGGPAAGGAGARWLAAGRVGLGSVAARASSPWRSSPARTERVDDALPLLLARARAGDGLAAGWADVARRTGSPEVELLARAWSLSESSGASLSAAARTAVHLLRQGRDERRRTQVAVAGARATMSVLTALPLGGPALALLLGLDLGSVYLSSPAAAAMLGGGVLLVLLGRWWVAGMVAATLRGPALLRGGRW